MALIILPVIDTESIGWAFNSPTNAEARVLVRASVTTTSTLGSGVQLIGDVDIPGASMAYSTDTLGNKGWHTFAGGGGVTGLQVQGNPLLTGDVTLIQGSNVTLTQSGQNITIASSGGGGGGGGDFFGIASFTAPSDTGFSWDNQGSATLTVGSNYLSLSCPAGGSTTNIHVRYKTAPATPYTITAFVLKTTSGSSDSALEPSVNLIFRASGSGKIETFGVADAGGDCKVVQFAYNSATSLANVNTNGRAPYGNIFWLRIADNGTNRIYSISIDGINFLQVSSEGRTNFMTADQVGFAIRSDAACAMTIVSWVES